MSRIQNSLILGALLVASASPVMAQRLSPNIPVYTVPVQMKDGTVMECTFRVSDKQRVGCRVWRSYPGAPSAGTQKFDDILNNGKELRDGLDEVQEYLPDEIAEGVGKAKPFVDGFNILVSSQAARRRSQDRVQGFLDSYGDARDNFSPQAQELMLQQTNKNIRQESNNELRRATEGPVSRESVPYAYDALRDSFSVVTDGHSDPVFDGLEDHFGSQLPTNGDEPFDGYSSPVGPTLPNGTFWTEGNDPLAFGESLVGQGRTRRPRPTIPAGSKGPAAVHPEFGGTAASSNPSTEPAPQSTPAPQWICNAGPGGTCAQ